MTIFLVQSGLKHDGQLYKKGSMFEADAGTFRHLVNDVTLREIEGASSFEEAEKILAKEEEREVGGDEDIAVSPDTWGPQPDVPTEDETKEEEEKKTGNSGSILGRLFGSKTDETTMPTEDETTTADGSVETPATTDGSTPATETPADGTDSEQGDNL